MKCNCQFEEGHSRACPAFVEPPNPSIKQPEDEFVEETVSFIMETANGIDDYNWGQDKFEEELRTRLHRHEQHLRKKWEMEVVEKIEGEGFANPAEAGQFSLHADGYNQAIDDIISLITNK
jgi:hypothetical protein